MNSGGVSDLNENADVIGQRYALAMNITAAKGLQSLLETNLGPRGTLKMLVSGGGQVKVTKDGKCLLEEMQLQHPTASLIARTAKAQDDISGDGTTSTVLFTGELLKQCERYIAEGLHPRLLAEGVEQAREHMLTFLDSFQVEVTDEKVPRQTLVEVARTSLRTKVQPELADHLTEIVVDAVSTIHRPDEPLDLFMVEIMHMRHESAMDTKFIDGLVLDHGARHPGMAKDNKNCHILILNASLEYEKSEVNSSFVYSDAQKRTALAKAERKFTDDRVQKVIDFKNEVCGEDESFIVINQKGIDPPSLDMLQKAGIVGIRRAKRRNMERLAKACGGFAVNSVEDLTADCLGWAGHVYEHVLGDDKFTFVEQTKEPTSCTVLIKGPNDHTIRQVKDALRDGLRAVKNLLEDQSLVPGAGCFELAAHFELLKFKRTVKGRAKIGVQAFADAMLVIPKALAQNAGLDAQGVIIELLESVAKGKRIGLDLSTGKPMQPEKQGVWDNTRVKRQFLHLGTMIATKLLLVDEVIRAGRKMGKGPEQ